MSSLHSQDFLDYSILMQDSGPPSNLNESPGGGGGNENGVRVITKLECQRAVNAWFQKLGTANTPQQIVQLEQLMGLQHFSIAMPGLRPHRNELLAVGEFVDGVITCIAGIYWRKNLCPDEMDVVSLTQSPRERSDSHFEPVLEFVHDLCANNAIIPNYLMLQDRVLYPQPSIHRFFKHTLGQSTSPTTYLNPHSILSPSQQQVVSRYQAYNRAPLVCLDDVSYLASDNLPTTSIDLGPYWYRVLVPHPQDSTVQVKVYFRNKRWRDFEYEWSFSKPSTGINRETGSGTASGRMILSLLSDAHGRLVEDRRANEHKQVPGVRWEDVIYVARKITQKIVHPPLSEFSSSFRGGHNHESKWSEEEESVRR